MESENSNLKKVKQAIFEATAKIAELLRVSQADFIESNNAFGDKQLKADVETEKIILEELRNTGAVKFALSEETPKPISL